MNGLILPLSAAGSCATDCIMLSGPTMLIEGKRTYTQQSLKLSAKLRDGHAPQAYSAVSTDLHGRSVTFIDLYGRSVNQSQLCEAHCTTLPYSGEASRRVNKAQSK